VSHVTEYTRTAPSATALVDTMTLYTPTPSHTTVNALEASTWTWYPFAYGAVVCEMEYVTDDTPVRVVGTMDGYCPLPIARGAITERPAGTVIVPVAGGEELAINRVTIA
jgi:hypothetical protein